MNNTFKKIKSGLEPAIDFLSKMFTKLVKLLGTDKNTFTGVIFTAIAIYFTVDAILGIIITFRSTIAPAYYGYILQVLAISSPFLGYMFMSESPRIKEKENRQKLFRIYSFMFSVITAYIFAMILNKITWTVVFSTQNYMDLIQGERGVIYSALKAIAFVIPFITFSYFWNLVNTKVFAEKENKEAITNAKGFRFKGEPKKVTYPDTLAVGNTLEHGVNIELTQESRMLHSLVLGNEKSEKTKYIFEPFISEDIKKKVKLREETKKIALDLIHAKKIKLIDGNTLDNIKQNFKLNMIEPTEGHFEEVNDIFSDYEIREGELQDLGITYISENKESIKLVEQMAKNNNIKTIIVDSDDPNSFGLNPFAYSDPERAAFYAAQTFDILSTPKDNTTLTNEQRTLIHNLAIILKINYPKQNKGKTPTLLDLAKIVNDEVKMKDLLQDFKSEANNVINYDNAINYFKKSFKDLPKIQKEFIDAFNVAISDKAVKTVLNNRSKNLDLRKAVTNGTTALIYLNNKGANPVAFSTLQELVISLYYEALISKFKRNVSTIPNYIYMPDFAKYLSLDILEKISNFKKYNAAVTIGAKNPDEISSKVDINAVSKTFANKFILGGFNPEVLKYWESKFRENTDNNEITAERMANIKNGKFAFKIATKDSFIVDIASPYLLDKSLYNSSKALNAGKDNNNNNNNNNNQNNDTKTKTNNDNDSNKNSDDKQEKNPPKVMSAEEFKKSYNQHLENLNKKTRAAFLYDDEEDIDFDFNDVMDAYAPKKKNKNKKRNNNSNNNNKSKTKTKNNNNETKKQNNNNQNQKSTQNNKKNSENKKTNNNQSKKQNNNNSNKDNNKKSNSNKQENSKKNNTKNNTQKNNPNNNSNNNNPKPKVRLKNEIKNFDNIDDILNANPDADVNNK